MKLYDKVRQLLYVMSCRTRNDIFIEDSNYYNTQTKKEKRFIENILANKNLYLNIMPKLCPDPNSTPFSDLNTNNSFTLYDFEYDEQLSSTINSYIDYSNKSSPNSQINNNQDQSDLLPKSQNAQQKNGKDNKFEELIRLKFEAVYNQSFPTIQDLMGYRRKKLNNQQTKNHINWRQIAEETGMTAQQAYHKFIALENQNLPRWPATLKSQIQQETLKMLQQSINEKSIKEQLRAKYNENLKEYQQKQFYNFINNMINSYNSGKQSKQ